VIPFFAFPDDVRRIIYTTNAIESLNAKLRRAVRTRGHFPTDESALKLPFLVLNLAAKEWKMPPPEWCMANSPSCSKSVSPWPDENRPYTEFLILSAAGDPGSAHRLGLPVRRHLPRTRHRAALIMPRANTKAMQGHLNEIAGAVSPGAHAVVLLDQAGWHTTLKLSVPGNITLPPRSPELNPAENLWQFLRQTFLSNRVFETYDAILDAACHAILEAPWRITSIGLRKWAYTGQL
jgi:hypothetical protein